MAKHPREEFYWPLGELSHASEIRDYFAEESELLGVITILWNRQEIRLKSIYKRIIASKREAFAEAIWDRQPTHQARRDTLALALTTVKLTKRQKAILGFVIEKTKDIADRRNDLIHAEYVVHGRTEKLHAKIRSPRSTKPPKHQRASAEDLLLVIEELETLLGFTDAAWFEFDTRKGKAIQASLNRLAKSIPIFRENPHGGLGPPSLRRRPDGES